MQKMMQAVYEFHVSRQARDFYELDETLYAATGNVILANVYAARLLAQKMNARRNLQAAPDTAVRAGELHAMGLIDEIMHHLIAEYRRRRNPRAMELALDFLEERLGPQEVNDTLLRFTLDFPPAVVYRGEQSAFEYLSSYSTRPGGVPISNREIALEEMLLLWLENENPAFGPFLELFDDADLERDTAYYRIFPALYEYFDEQPGFGPGNQNLIDVLLAPAREHPDSLAAQLSFLQQSWGEVLQFILLRLMSSLDTLREEGKPFFTGAGGPGGGGPVEILEFGGADFLFEPERFSVDLDWMPNLVLLAKNTYVWLDQLARAYQRPINRLDQVPDEELEMLRRRGITGLWLIGLWERSPASQRIKQLRGNANAVASAYSLFSYDIAADLGGEEAYSRLRDRAWRYGIRLASDMVPNHMGIDSRWVIEHPDWFLQLPYSPFPAYSFNGPNLSWDNRVGLFIDDHYFDNTDAAVVFKRVDFWSGSESYIYHGNDGTSIPWNDTAQLNFLIPEVREAVIQTILHVARKFPIIRFDAAMTLAKRHYQRLWFPEPGTGGAIASRAEHGLTKPQFDQVFPEEFWRMVVDRVAQEAPDTLLLAEAFWMMEGYFVRTLGMHRVYNSAFMNLLRDEKNAEYRLVMKNTLEFDQEIIKRFVNFMNNPDERTAVDQFGKSDKYFGVCAMLATLPGLPMIGHGQVEGFGEKYGMEFRYPMWHETPDEALVARHEREIFPLLRRRYLFAEAHDFLLYDFFTTDGVVNEDVYAYSNRAGDQASLVVYHNRFAETGGWINNSAAYAVKTGQGDEKVLVQRRLGQGLGLSDDPNAYTIFRDHINGLEFIRSSREILYQGMYLELRAYEYHVFLGFRQVWDGADGLYGRLASELAGRGVSSIDDARRELQLQPVLVPFRELVNPGMFRWLIDNRLEAETYEPANFRMALDEVEMKSRDILAALVSEGYAVSAELVSEAEPLEAPADVAAVAPVETEHLAAVQSEVGAHRTMAEQIDDIAGSMRSTTEALLSLSAVESGGGTKPTTEFRHALDYLLSGPHARSPLRSGDPAVWGVLLAAMAVDALGEINAPMDETNGHSPQKRSRAWLDELWFGKAIADALVGLGVDPAAARRSALLVGVLTDHGGADVEGDDATMRAKNLLKKWLADDAACQYIMVHDYDGVHWFNQEAFEDLAWWSCAWETVRSRALLTEANSAGTRLLSIYRNVLALLDAEQRSGYRVDKLLD